MLYRLSEIIKNFRNIIDAQVTSNLPPPPNTYTLPHVGREGMKPQVNETECTVDKKAEIQEKEKD